jgi:hypothetical protein
MNLACLSIRVLMPGRLAYSLLSRARFAAK